MPPPPESAAAVAEPPAELAAPPSLARIAGDGRAGVIAATVAAPSWLVLFNADFGRMYAQFLFFGALAPLLLLRAIDNGRRRDWVLWWLACLGVLASHPYGAFVLAAG